MWYKSLDKDLFRLFIYFGLFFFYHMKKKLFVEENFCRMLKKLSPLLYLLF